VGPRAILARLLRNLKAIYTHLDDTIKLFQAVEWIISLDPDAASEFKTRGFIYENLGAFDLAARDLEKYLSLAPESPDALTIRSKIEELKGKTSWLH
jgi:regulator of sirC expression with transglutaminase-like and TPR domain